MHCASLVCTYYYYFRIITIVSLLLFLLLLFSCLIKLSLSQLTGFTFHFSPPSQRGRGEGERTAAWCLAAGRVKPRHPGSPFPEPEDESLRHHGTACTHAAHGRTTVSWGRLPRAARNRTPNTARLARTSARTRAKGLGTAGPTLPVDGHTGPAIAIPETPVV